MRVDVLQLTEKIQDWRDENQNGVVVVRWATATGKSSLSLEIADSIGSEIISADSRQVYREMNIGTDKVSVEARETVPHHLIDIKNPDEKYTAWEWKRDTESIIEWILNRKRLPMVVWWTWLYIDMLYKNYTLPELNPQRERREEQEKREEENPWILFADLQRADPEESLKHHPNSLRYIIRALEICAFTWKTKTYFSQQLPVKRPLYMVWLWREKEDTNMRINKRIREMMSEWLIEEVQWLLDAGYTREMQSMQSIGYKEVIEYLSGWSTKEKMIETLKRNTHHYAKKQRTRFRRYIAEWKAMPKENVIYDIYPLSWS